MKRISKTRQAKMREEEVKSTLKFGVKLVLVLAVVIGCAQLFFYGKNVMADRSNGPAAWIAAENSQTKDNPSDSSGLSKTGESEKEEQEETAGPETKEGTTGGLASKEMQTGEPVSGIVLDPFLPDSEKGQQTPETIAPFAVSSDGPGNVVQAAPPLGEGALGPAGGGNELFPVSGPADASKPMIAFTFDDGPYYSVDSRILDTLQAYGGRATFFIVGSRVNDYKDTIKRIRDSGSEIGNHTFNHKNLEKISPEEVTSQIEMTNDAVEAVTGFRPKLVRVPYGAFKGQVPGLVSYPMIQWNIDTQDWSSKDKDAIAASVLSQARDGSIILMHDLYSATAEAFETVIPLLAAQGYRFVTVSEMYAAKGVPLEAGQVYFNIPKG
ncbi:MAG: polysaccharide deacetylase family protein [Enterocloster bolteae]